MPVHDDGGEYAVCLYRSFILEGPQTMKNSKWTHTPSQIKHGGTEFDAGWQECYDTKVIALHNALENALIDLQGYKQGNKDKTIQGLIKDLLKAIKECDK